MSSKGSIVTVGTTCVKGSLTLRLIKGEPAYVPIRPIIIMCHFFKASPHEALTPQEVPYINKLMNPIFTKPIASTITHCLSTH